MPLDPRGRVVPRATPGAVDAAHANFTLREGARHDLGAMADNLEAGSPPPPPSCPVRAPPRHDLGAMADNLEAGFISYKTWADFLWEPPSRVEMLLGLMQRFQHDRSWSFVGFGDKQRDG